MGGFCTSWKQLNFSSVYFIIAEALEKICIYQPLFILVQYFCKANQIHTIKSLILRVFIHRSRANQTKACPIIGASVSGMFSYWPANFVQFKYNLRLMPRRYRLISGALSILI